MLHVDQTNRLKRVDIGPNLFLLGLSVTVTIGVCVLTPIVMETVETITLCKTRYKDE